MLIMPRSKNGFWGFIGHSILHSFICNLVLYSALPISLKTTHSHYSKSSVASLAQIIKFFTLSIDFLQWTLNLLYHTEETLSSAPECNMKITSIRAAKLSHYNIQWSLRRLRCHTPVCISITSIPCSVASMVHVPSADEQLYFPW